jgi:hypothetical protein
MGFGFSALTRRPTGRAHYPGAQSRNFMRVPLPRVSPARGPVYRPGNKSMFQRRFLTNELRQGARSTTDASVGVIDHRQWNFQRSARSRPRLPSEWSHGTATAKGKDGHRAHDSGVVANRLSRFWESEGLHDWVSRLSSKQYTIRCSSDVF